MLQEFVQAVNDAVRRGIGTMHTAIPGRILNFDAKTGRADVLPVAIYRMPDGTLLNYPKITDVPVMFPGNGKAGIYFPLEEGDDCLLIFAEKSLEYWTTGQITDTELDFDLTNAICIPGLMQNGNKSLVDAYDSNSLILNVNGTTVTLKDGLLSLVAPKIKMEGVLETDPPMIELDTTLTFSGKAADAKAVGDKINKLCSDIAAVLDEINGTVV